MKKIATAPKLDTERFQLEGEIGKGGMGWCCASRPLPEPALAMKVLLERAAPRDEEQQKLAHQMLGRFLEEAQVTSQLDHPGWCRCTSLGWTRRQVYFTMRLVKGRTANEVFADCLQESDEWNLVRGLEVILKVCDTMAYAHDKGAAPGPEAAERDGRAFGEVYVMDWGLAKVVGSRTGTTCGSART